jgi:hypothetical protein
MYGMISKLPLRGLVRESVLKMMLDMYGPAGKMPQLTADEPKDWQERAGLWFLKQRQKLDNWRGRKA